MKLIDHIRGINRVLVIAPGITDMTGSNNATILLCKLIDWLDYERPIDGWLYKTRTQIWEATRLNRTEQENARKRLRRLAILLEAYRGQTKELHFKIDHDAMQTAWDATRPAALPRSLHMPEIEKLNKINEQQETCQSKNSIKSMNSRKPAIRSAGNLLPIRTTTSTKTKRLEDRGGSARTPKRRGVRTGPQAPQYDALRFEEETPEAETAARPTSVATATPEPAAALGDLPAPAAAVLQALDIMRQSRRRFATSDTFIQALATALTRVGVAHTRHYGFDGPSGKAYTLHFLLEDGQTGVMVCGANASQSALDTLRRWGQGGLVVLWQADQAYDDRGVMPVLGCDLSRPGKWALPEDDRTLVPVDWQPDDGTREQARAAGYLDYWTGARVADFTRHFVTYHRSHRIPIAEPAALWLDWLARDVRADPQWRGFETRWQEGQAAQEVEAPVELPADDVPEATELREILQGFKYYGTAAAEAEPSRPQRRGVASGLEEERRTLLTAIDRLRIDGRIEHETCRDLRTRARGAQLAETLEGLWDEVQRY